MKSIQVLAFDIATSMATTKLAVAWQSSTNKLIAKNPYIWRLPGEKYLVVFEYGSLVFFNFNLEEANSWLNKLKTFAQRAHRKEFTDTFILYIGGKKNSLNANELRVERFLVDTIKLVAIVLSRSVGLEYYEDLIDRNLEKLEESVESLSYNGKFIASRRQLIKQVGLTHAIQHELAYNLALLDDPDVVWARGEEMEKLYKSLSDQYKINNRVQVIERKLSLITRSSQFILECLQDRTSNLLEAAIVFLFVVDIVFILIELFGR